MGCRRPGWKHLPGLQGRRAVKKSIVRRNLVKVRIAFGPNLFPVPRTDTDITHLAGENVQGSLDQRVVAQGSPLLLRGQPIGRIDLAGHGPGNLEMNPQIILKEVENVFSQSVHVLPLLEHAAVGLVLKTDNQGVALLPGRGGKLEGRRHPALPLMHVFEKGVPVLADFSLAGCSGSARHGGRWFGHSTGSWFWCRRLWIG